MRIVPRPNEAINETWIPDRDRFSYEGIYAEDRLKTPMLRQGDKWQSVDWETALDAATKNLQAIVKQHGPMSLGALAVPGSTVEELYLLNRLVRGIGSANLDHRLRQQDFRDQESDPLFPSLGLAISDLERLNSVLVIGSNLRREAPILAHRLRKAATRNAARVAFVNARRYEYLFPISTYVTAPDREFTLALAGIVNAAAEKGGKPVPEHVRAVATGIRPRDEHRAIAAQLFEGEGRAILIGALALRHPAYADIRQLAAALASVTGAQLGYIPEGSNAAGAALAGVLPHRDTGGQPVGAAGLTARAMLESPLKAYLLLGGIEPAHDLGVANAARTLAAAECVVMLTPYATDAMRKFAHVLLPVGTFAETSGTYINIEGRWQSFLGVAHPVGESRPAWKVLRVLGNLLDLSGFGYETSEAVRDELRNRLGDARADNRFAARRVLNGERPAGAAADVPMYQIDALVRRAPALQHTREAPQTPGQ
jgi:NADH-quinone oxidoreductase subunit G